MNSIDVAAIREELVQALSQTFDDSVGVAIYGAGDTAIRCLDPFLEDSIVPTCFIDDTPGRAGETLFGKPIINFEEAHKKCKSFLIIPCSFVIETRKIMADSLRKYPIEGVEICMSLDEYVFCKNANKVLAVFDMLGDKFSKETYANMIMSRMGKVEQNPEFTLIGQNYFAIAPFLRQNFGEVFVDCGAYVGDTLERFLTVRDGTTFQKIFAFEPFEKNFKAMKVRVERLIREWGLNDDQIELVQAGVGETAYKSGLIINNQADCCAISSESVEENSGISVVSIDKFFVKQPITFLKADVEGYEWRMLHGAEQVIRRDRPKLAICIYHTPTDMYRIELWIKSLCPDYKFEVRQHRYEWWDTVLYAYV